VKAESPAARAGLTTGDVIVGYDGSPLKSHKALRRAIFDAEAELEDGERESDEVVVDVWRRGETRRLTFPLGSLGVVVAKTPPREAWESIEAGAPRRGWTAERGAGTRYDVLEPLPGTRREVNAIRESLAKVKTAAGGGFEVVDLLGEEATKPRLYSLAPRARFLHLATHHLAEQTDDALDSRLALTLPRVPTATDDGFLKLIDLLERWRDHIAACELVVLSACESQRGRLRRDEGVFAMPWGFHYAGCPSVVASLWRVDDESTAEMMSGFYARLATDETKSKLEAFTEARKALRKRFPEPYFWAPFVLIGDPR
jgi:CHAT domain-containing protein